MAKKYSIKVSAQGKSKRSKTKKTSSQHKKNSNKSKKQPNRLELATKNSPRARAKLHKKIKLSKDFKTKLKKVLIVVAGIALTVVVLAGIWFFGYLQRLDQQLPPVDDPFRSREIASVIYDRSGNTELYKLFNEFNRDPVDIEAIPEHVKWAFLAAEDVDFYTHQGFDLMGIIRCAFINISQGTTACGGSTVTQQMVKLTSIGNEARIERKLKELLMSLKVEQAYTKDEILQMYLTVAPFGSNIYGITAASEFYFDKEPKDLSLEEAAILASIIQSPGLLSPTLSKDTTRVNEEGEKITVTAKERVKERQEYVLGQIKIHMDTINNQHRVNIDDPEAENLFNDELVDEALAAELKYQPPVITNIKAGHFVQYAIDLLQERNYKNAEEPFTLTELQTGGYEIYTTLDWDLQQISERTVRDAVNSQRPVHNMENAALMTMQPSTGEIYAMVGSRDYYGESSGCNSDGSECRFDPQVNILNTPHSPGSSTKQHGYYEAYRQGKLFPGSFLPDINIDIGAGYTIQNWNGQSRGATNDTYAAQVLRQSLNLPAIIVAELIGVENFLKTMQAFGYTTFDDFSRFGHAAIIGGSDVIPIEHAQGHSVFANGGDFVQHEVIKRIVDRDGNVVYESEPERERVADPQAIFLTNQSMNNNYNMSNRAGWGGADLASKTGTSEDNQDVWLAVWSPDVVSLAWMGNNDNSNMASNAFGETAVLPWMIGYMSNVGSIEPFNKRSSFERPGGIIRGGGCSGDGCEGEVTGLRSGYMIEGKIPPADVIYETVQVCTDQEDRLARDIDIELGKAKERTFTYYKMPIERFQDTLDQHMREKQGIRNGAPTEFCNRDRSGVGADVWVDSFSATATGSSLNVQGNAYTTEGGVTQVEIFLDSTSNSVGVIDVSGGASFDSTFTFSGSYEPGIYNVIGRVTNTAGETSDATTTVVLGGSETSSNFNLTLPASPLVHGTDIGAGNAETVTMSYSGLGSLNSVTLFAREVSGSWQEVGQMVDSGTIWNISWGDTLPAAAANYEFYVTATTANSGQLTSEVFGITEVIL